MFLRQKNIRLDKSEVCGAYIAVFVYNLGKSLHSEPQNFFPPKLRSNSHFVKVCSPKEFGNERYHWLHFDCDFSSLLSAQRFLSSAVLTNAFTQSESTKCDVCILCSSNNLKGNNLHSSSDYGGVLKAWSPRSFLFPLKQYFSGMWRMQTWPLEATFPFSYVFLL